MSAPHKLRATALTIISLTAAALIPAGSAAEGAVTQRAGSSGSSTGALRAPAAHSHCPAGDARGRRSRRGDGHACRSRSQDGHTPEQTRLRPQRQPRQRSQPRQHSPHPPRTTPSAATTEGALTAQASAAPTHQAIIASVLATPCANTEITPEAGNIALARAAVLCLINRERAENDETPLTTNSELERAAEGHCREMIADDYFAHVSPSGETPVDRIRETGYIPNSNVGYVIGENLAWGTYQLSTPQAIVAAWIASPGHLANILESKYTETGIALAPAVPESLAPGAPGATYAQEFGVIVE